MVGEGPDFQFSEIEFIVPEKDVLQCHKQTTGINMAIGGYAIRVCSLLCHYYVSALI